ncbi:MAG TPA: histone H1-like repetitive region-containing protein, partial [Polyangiaceae bacterium]|nr:histone H1-like repetitive region-containing protein [Polyangiaceae bacterium]
MTKKKPTAKPAAKKVTAKKVTAKKTPAKKTPAKKTAATGAPAKRTTAKKSTAKKVPAKKTTAKKIAAKTTPTPAKRPPAKKAAAAAPAGDLHATLARLDEALRTYAPSRKAAMRPAPSLAALERLGPVPEALRALWAWCDGCSELLPMSAAPDAAQLDLLSASEAAEALASIREALEDEDEDATFPHVPFATEPGSGNFVVLDARGRALYWDHEEGAVEPAPVAPSLDALLARALAAVQKKRLFGGPEPAPGAPHPGVARCEKLLRDPARNFDELMEKTTFYGQKNALPPAERYRLRRGLAAFAATRSAEERDAFHTQLADSAIEAGALDDALGLLDAAGVGARSEDTHAWRMLGDAALQAGRYELAAEAFSPRLSVLP